MKKAPLIILICHIITSVNFAQCTGLASILVLSPETEEEFYNIYQRKPRSDELENILKLKHENKCESCTRYGKSELDLKKYIEIHKNSDARYFLIIGHNDEGELFMPDGNSISLKAIEELSIKEGIKTVYLTCSAKKYIPSSSKNPAVNFNLSLKEAYKIANEIDAYKCNEMLSPPADPDKRMNEILDNAKFNSDARFIATVFGPLSAGAGLVIIKATRSDQVDKNNSKEIPDSTINRE